MNEPMAELDPTWSKLQSIGTNVMYMESPKGEKHTKTIANARKYVANELHGMGYSHRQIAEVLGLKSPQSISQYLSSTKTKLAEGV